MKTFVHAMAALWLLMTSAAHAAPQPAGPLGAVAMSVSLNPFHTIDVSVRRTDAKGKLTLTTHRSGLFPPPISAQSDSSIEEVPASLIAEGLEPMLGTSQNVVYKTLPPGKYVISKLRVSDARTDFYWSSQDDIAFEVRPGMTTYLGQFEWVEMWGKGRIGFSYPQGWFFTITDKFERDQGWLKAQQPDAMELRSEVPTTWNREPWFN